ncbi:hypothetical protein HOY82DRAFT_556623 [Tuber indicum]|nr:hypothetical protein HOY82DRAFT_558405 [Tuber indicum]KAG0133243.1 hypothetical protein HOY82DRAFT_556623 [Tuber indicum]
MVFAAGVAVVLAVLCAPGAGRQEAGRVELFGWNRVSRYARVMIFLRVSYQYGFNTKRLGAGLDQPPSLPFPWSPNESITCQYHNTKDSKRHPSTPNPFLPTFTCTAAHASARQGPRRELFHVN